MIPKSKPRQSVCLKCGKQIEFRRMPSNVLVWIHTEIYDIAPHQPLAKTKRLKGLK